MAMRAVAIVASDRLFDRQVDQRFAAKLFRKRPSLRLVQFHQRRVDVEMRVHRKAESLRRGFDRFIAAIGIAGIIGLAHAADEIADASPVRQRRRRAQKEDIARGHEARRQAILTHLDFHVLGER